MNEMLATNMVHRLMTAADLNIPGTPEGVEPLLAARLDSVSLPFSGFASIHAVRDSLLQYRAGQVASLLPVADLAPNSNPTIDVLCKGQTQSGSATGTRFDGENVRGEANSIPRSHLRNEMWETAASGPWALALANAQRGGSTQHTAVIDCVMNGSGSEYWSTKTELDERSSIAADLALVDLLALSADSVDHPAITPDTDDGRGEIATIKGIIGDQGQNETTSGAYGNEAMIAAIALGVLTSRLIPDDFRKEQSRSHAPLSPAIKNKSETESND
jgi:hypothetical protein